MSKNTQTLSHLNNETKLSNLVNQMNSGSLTKARVVGVSYTSTTTLRVMISRRKEDCYE